MSSVQYLGRPLTLRERVANFLVKGLGEGGGPLPVTQSVDGLTTGAMTASFYEPSARNNLRFGYKQNSAVFACVAAYADAFAEAPLCVYDAPPEAGGKKNPKHPVQALLKNPNPLMGEDNFWKYLIVYAGFGGNCYQQKVRNSAGLPIQLWPYHDVRMRPVEGGAEWLDHYEYRLDANSVKVVPKEDIIAHPWMVDPARPWMGMSPLVPIAREVDTDSELTRYLKALLENDAVARGILELPEGVVWNKEKRDLEKAVWKQQMGGANRGDIAILGGGLKYTRIGLNLQELAFDALRGVPEARIASAYRVPPIVAGLSIGLARSTFANYEEARKAFTEQTISPRWAMVASQMQRSLAEDYGNDFYLGFDTSRVSAFKENNASTWQRATEAYNAGGLKLNEYRDILGQAPVPGGDVFLGDLAAGSEEPTTGAKRLWRGAEYKEEQRLKKIEQRLARDLQKHLDEQYAALASRLEGAA